MHIFVFVEHLIKSSAQEKCAQDGACVAVPRCKRENKFLSEMPNSPKLLLGITNKNDNSEWKRFSGDYQYHFQTFWKKRHQMPSNEDGKNHAFMYSWASL